MKKRNVIITTLVAIVVLAAVPFVYGQGMRHYAAASQAGGFGFMFGRLERAQQALGLTDDQVTQLKAIATDLRTQNAPFRAQLRGGRQQVAQTLLADPSNTAAAQTILDQQAAAHNAVQANTLAAVSKALTVLTPDQRTKVGEFLAKRAARAQSFGQNH